MRLGIRVLNRIGGVLRRMGAGELSEQSVLRGARRASGIEPLGPERFREPLGLLLEAYDRDPLLTFAGRLIARRRLIHLVANRQRIFDQLEREPRILDQEIRRPLFVVGLPRSGTTLLHHLLAKDQTSRALLFWETMCPAPPPDPATRQHDPRIKQAARTVAWLNRALPQLKAIHKLQPQGPDECLGLLMNTFTTPYLAGRAPDYFQWLYGLSHHEMVTAYQEYRQQLLLLQWRVDTPRWLLKCPSHLFGLSALLDVFPDACVVQTHRDPAKAVASICSLTAVLDRLVSARIDREDIGRRELEIVEQLTGRSMNARRGHTGTRIIDVHYHRLVADPLATVRRIYDHFGFEVDPGMEERIRAHLAANPQHKHGVHRYRLEDFGLSRAVIQSRLAAYYERFAIEPEAEC